MWLLLAGTWLLIIGLMLLVWGIYLCIGNTSIVDVFWSIAIASAALCYSGIGEHAQGVIWIQAVLVLWALRLSGFLFVTRIVRRKVDNRYEELASGWQMKKHLGFLLNFQFQGLLAMVIACPFLFIAKLDHVVTISDFSKIGLGIIMVAILLETLADIQLLRFARKKTAGVCAVGLWRYSRHPNYFFDWVVWLGFATLATQAKWGWFSYVSPLLLLFLMCGITIPLTEKQSLKSRGQPYADYQAATSMFFPKWRKAKR